MKVGDGVSHMNHLAEVQEVAELAKRVEELESQIEEMWDRMKQIENVLSTAFRLAPIGELKRYNK